MSNKCMLVCVDGSEIADAAFNYAINQLYRPGDRMLLLKVPEYDVSMQALGGDWEKIVQTVKGHTEQIEAMYANYSKLLREKGIEGEGVKLSGGGKPGEVICREAREKGATHIVMGSRGLGRLQRAFLGSVSNYVLNHADMPVTIVPKQKS